MDPKMIAAIETQVALYKGPTFKSNFTAQKYVTHVEALLAEREELLYRVTRAEALVDIATMENGPVTNYRGEP